MRLKLTVASILIGLAVCVPTLAFIWPPNSLSERKLPRAIEKIIDSLMGADHIHASGRARNETAMQVRTIAMDLTTFMMECKEWRSQITIQKGTSLNSTAVFQALRGTNASTQLLSPDMVQECVNNRNKILDQWGNELHFQLRMNAATRKVTIAVWSNGSDERDDGGKVD